MTIFGDGKQTRSFMYIDDCIDGTLKLFNSNYRDPLNIGSDEMVTINTMIKYIEMISKSGSLNKKYIPNGNLGVRGRNSDNTISKKILKWEYKTKLYEGLTKTYSWVENEINFPNNKSHIFKRP